MSNQETQNQIHTIEVAAVEKRRRFIKGAAAATPVILTLASPSVFGQEECLSLQLSGNASNFQGSCVKGNNADYWKNRSNSWPAGFTRDTSCGDNTGTKFNAPAAFGPGAPAVGTGPSTDSLEKILCAADANYVNWVVALLNSVAVPNYILTTQQLLDLYHYDAPPSNFLNTAAGKIAFLATTF